MAAQKAEQQTKAFMKLRTLVITAAAVLVSAWTGNASITGNPLADGFTLQGYSLEQGVYVRNGGTVNYGYDAYGSSFTIQATDANLISSGLGTWKAGDTVYGVGGVFAVEDPGWTITGDAINAMGLSTDLKLQAKFGSDTANFSASTIAPVAGNGNGSLGSNGGEGAVQVRTSAYNTAAIWIAGNGLVNTETSDHVARNVLSVNEQVVRLIWNYDATASKMLSWEILLNVSMLESLYGGEVGNLALMTVQYDDSGYTDALVNIPQVPVPEPTTMIAGALLLLPFGASTLRMLRKSRKA